MTAAEAIAEIEALFTVHETVGMPTAWTDQGDKVLSMAARDMDLAPNGEPYEVMTSFGLGAEIPRDALVLFQNEGLALQWWVDEVKATADDIAKREGRRPQHLYWREKPVFLTTTYLAMNQSGLLGTASPLAAIAQIDLGFVYSRLLISTIGPDGE